MKKFILFRTIIPTIMLAMGSHSGNSQTLIAGWDFQTTTNCGTAVNAAPYIPNAFVANFGTGTLYLNGSNGSSNWITTTPGNEITALTGCYLNAGPDFSTLTTGYASLGFLSGTNCSANGKHMVFKFTMASKSNLNVSYAAKRNSAGFTTQTWDYSTDSITWTHLQTITDICTEFFDTLILNTITELDNAETAYLRMSPAGACEATGYNKIDNIQFNAEASVATRTGVANDSGTNLSVSNGIIRFKSNAGKQVEIYNTIGLKLINKRTIEGLNTIPVLAKGIVIIKIDNRISKVFL